ncbi:MAG TPA: hypothetical protein ENJ51_01805 [Leucothrix mucor]|uniref:Polysaccharide deacetylase n=1 Tax=Leucothrix mucor TaxID=45248 RepID=A0A7V2SXY2_LEUMU|nr:hypothetical protein [Leucothrix mucor]
MATYQLSSIQKTYKFSANPPVLDKVVFTIDHIHAGDHHLSSTYEVVKFLTDHGIPITVFIQATNPSNDYEFDRSNARLIYNLAPHLVTLGVHPLPKGHSQAQQRDTLNIINRIIQDITRKRPITLSYHGSGAGPMLGISFPGIQFARGIHHTWAVNSDNRLDTPVMPLVSVSRAYEYIHERNNARLSATLFVHSTELRHGSRQRRVFDTLVRDVIQHRLQALPYLQAMQQDFRSDGATAVTTQPTEIGVMRLSALTKQGKRPIPVNLSIKQRDGNYSTSASNTTSRQFSLPVGKYRVSAKIGQTTETKDLSLNATQGIHHIFLMPV